MSNPTSLSFVIQFGSQKTLEKLGGLQKLRVVFENAYIARRTPQLLERMPLTEISACILRSVIKSNFLFPQRFPQHDDRERVSYRCLGIHRIALHCDSS